jgi:uncharacterized protein with PQ loop repeat
MIATETLGQISLNIAFVLYLINYFPQLLKNRHSENLSQLSINFHKLLLLTYLSDLIYGLGVRMPWQYCCVSIIGSLCLLYQHYQLSRLYQHLRIFRYVTVMMLSAFLMGVFLLYFLSPISKLFLVIGYFSQFCSILFFLPQIVKNIQLKSARSLSLSYITMGLISVLCDNIAAWCLLWPMPNKMGSAIQLLFFTAILMQCVYYFPFRFRNEGAPISAVS